LQEGHQDSYGFFGVLLGFVLSGVNPLRPSTGIAGMAFYKWHLMRCLSGLIAVGIDIAAHEPATHVVYRDGENVEGRETALREGLKYRH
jgi:hypothetical protein